MFESKVAVALRKHQKLKHFEIGSIWVDESDGRIYVVHDHACSLVPCKEITLINGKINAGETRLMSSRYAMRNFKPFK